MIHIHFNIELDATSDNLMAVASFMDSMKGQMPHHFDEPTTGRQVVAPDEPAKHTTNVKESPVKKTRKKKVVIPADTHIDDESAPADDPAAHGITIGEVRAFVAEKVDENRQGIKDKLTALGAKNVTTLDAKAYPEFMQFLGGL